MIPDPLPLCPILDPRSSIPDPRSMIPDQMFWAPDSQTDRLQELIAADDEIKEAPLRRDVRSLGQVLGQVLREQEGVAFFEQVEQVRTLAIAHREEFRNQTF